MSFVKISTGKAIIFVYDKFNYMCVYDEAILHFESKEYHGEVWVLCQQVHQLQSISTVNQ